MNMTIGERIRERRIAMGLTLEELSERMPCSGRACIYRYENGMTKPGPASLSKLASALGVSERYLESGDAQGQTTEKFILKSSPSCRVPIQVYPDTANVIRALAKQTGTKTADIVKQMADFCMKRMVISK